MVYLIDVEVVNIEKVRDDCSLIALGRKLHR